VHERIWVPKQTPEELARNVGRRVAEVRLSQGLTQQDFATLIRNSVQWISRIENGEENLTLATLVKLADALKLEVAELFRPPAPGARKAKRGRPKKVV
jgi:transcriptional regulator with XRE-family HTH domain